MKKSTKLSLLLVSCLYLFACNNHIWEIVANDGEAIIGDETIPEGSLADEATGRLFNGFFKFNDLKQPYPHTGQIIYPEPYKNGIKSINATFNEEGEIEEDRYYNTYSISYKNDDYYIGNIKDKLPQGFGKITFKTANKYGMTGFEGIFNKGIIKLNQDNVWIMYENDDRYFGYIKNGKPDGKGEMIYNNPRRESIITTFSGLFKDGDIDSSQQDVELEYFHNCDGKYKGGMLNGKPHGQGRIETLRGIYSGCFENGKFKTGTEVKILYKMDQLRYRELVNEKGQFHGSAKLYPPEHGIQ